MKRRPTIRPPTKKHHDLDLETYKLPDMYEEAYLEFTQSTKKTKKYIMAS